MSEQTRVVRPKPQRQRDRGEQTRTPIGGQQGTASSPTSTYREDAEQLRQRLQRLDAALASGVTNVPAAAGPSLAIGQQLAHQVVRPGTQIARSISNETLVQSFRQTSGE